MPKMRFSAAQVPRWVKVVQEASRGISRQWGFMGE